MEVRMADLMADNLAVLTVVATVGSKAEMLVESLDE